MQVAGPEGSRVRAGAKRAYLRTATVVAESELRDQAAGQHAGDDRLGERVLIDEVLRVEHELA